jgi:chromosome segregation ATPase
LSAVDIGRAQTAIADRLISLENSQQRPVEASLTPLVTQRLDSITTFATKLDNVERTFQLILDRLTGVERQLASAPDAKPFDLSPLDGRLASLERSINSSASVATDIGPVTELLSGIESRVAGLERSLENRSAESTRTVTFIGERLRTFEEAIGGQKAQTTDRLAQLERALSAYAENTVSNGSARGEELTELTEALLKLNANQQTLAQSLDQWRLDSTGDLSVIGNRLKSIEETEFQQNPLVDDLAAQVQAIHRTIARREARRSRFRHWLFGTDEWYSSSYDTARWRARQADSVIPTRVTETMSLQPRPTPPSPPASMLRR